MKVLKKILLVLVIVIALISIVKLLLIGYSNYYFSGTPIKPKELNEKDLRIVTPEEREEINSFLRKTEKDFSGELENQVDTGYYKRTKIKKDNVIKNNTPFYIDEKKYVRIFPEKLVIKDKYDGEEFLLLLDIQVEANFLNAAIKEYGCTIDESIVNSRNKYFEEVNNCINKSKNLEAFKEDQAILLFEMVYEISNTFGNKSNDEYPFYNL